MGYSSWSTKDWSTYSTRTASKTTDQIFKSRSLDKDLNPFKVLVRESRDSKENPNSTACIVACDVTGSMGVIADYLVRTGIGVFFEELLKRKPITDPHMMVVGIGDAACDRSPIQVSQFEADLTIAEWLEKIHIEHGGGGNDIESYDLPFYYAANHTSIDCWEKRQKKGYIFTIGDECAPKRTIASQVKKFIGDDLSEDILFSSVLDKAREMYHCYHIMIKQGSFAQSNKQKVERSWFDVMGQHALWLDDYTKLSETLVSLIQLTEGDSVDSIVGSWDGSTRMVVHSALSGVGDKQGLAKPSGVNITRL